MMSEHWMKVTVSANSSERSAADAAGRHMPVEELARRQGVQPIQSVEDLAQDDGFESDAEVDEFIAFVHAMRAPFYCSLPSRSLRSG